MASSLRFVKAKEAKEAFSAKQQQIERLKQHAFLEAGGLTESRNMDRWILTIDFGVY